MNDWQTETEKEALNAPCLLRPFLRIRLSLVGCFPALPTSVSPDTER